MFYIFALMHLQIRQLCLIGLLCNSTACDFICLMEAEMFFGAFAKILRFQWAANMSMFK